MEQQVIYLSKYDWTVRVFYNTKATDYTKVMDTLIDLGCTKDHLLRSFKNLTNGQANNGLTFTQPKLKKSVLAIGFTSTLSQFLNSFVHETLHLCQHIAEYYDINPYGEEICYLAGNIAQKMHHTLQPFMCECKKCK